MLARFAKSSTRVMMVARPTTQSVRPFFFGKNTLNTILPDIELAGGREKEELDAEAAGKVAFNRDPLVPTSDAGTKENPILVPSGFHQRVVGYEDPFTHQLMWFNLDEGALHYVPDINLYFKLSPIH